MGAAAKKASEESKQAARRALELDPQNANARAMFGFVLAWLDWQWSEGLAEVNRAAEVSPNSADVLNLQGDILRVAGELDRALEVKQRAWQLNPLEVVHNYDVAYVRLVRRDFDQAIAVGESTITAWPHNLDSYIPVILAAGRAGRFDLMRSMVEAARRNIDDGDGRLVLVAANAAAMDHRLDEARALLVRAAPLVESGKASPAYLGYCYLLAGDARKAATWLQRAVALHDPMLNWDVFIDYEVVAGSPLTRPILDVPGIRELRNIRRLNLQAVHAH
jgi:tetratricopeptide (TPR) repeat protein